MEDAGHALPVRPPGRPSTPFWPASARMQAEGERMHRDRHPLPGDAGRPGILRA